MACQDSNLEASEERYATLYTLESDVMMVRVSAGKLFAEVEISDEQPKQIQIVATLNNCVDAVSALMGEYANRGILTPFWEEDQDVDADAEAE